MAMLLLPAHCLKLLISTLYNTDGQACSKSKVPVFLLIPQKKLTTYNTSCENVAVPQLADMAKAMLL